MPGCARDHVRTCRNSRGIGDPTTLASGLGCVLRSALIAFTVLTARTSSALAAESTVALDGAIAVSTSSSGVDASKPDVPAALGAERTTSAPLSAPEGEQKPGTPPPAVGKAGPSKADEDTAGLSRASGVGPLAETAVATEGEGTAKKWRLTANLTQSLGQGTFVKDAYARTPDYGYLAGIGASYQVLPKLSVGSRFVWIQQLTVTNQDSKNGTVPRELQVRDLVFSASAPRLYREPLTGIEVGTGLNLNLPTSKASRSAQRLFGLGVRGNAGRLFEKVGPGDLALGYALSIVKNFGPASPDNDPGKHPSGQLCRAGNKDDAGNCLTSIATNNFYVLNDFNVAYTFLQDFTFTFDFLIWNRVSHDLSGSPLPRDVAATRDATIGTSPYATSGGQQTDATVATFEISYALTKNFTLSAGLYTFQPVFIQNGSSTHTLRFPFWDFQTPADNNSTFFLDVAFAY